MSSQEQSNEWKKHLFCPCQMTALDKKKIVFEKKINVYRLIKVRFTSILFAENLKFSNAIFKNLNCVHMIHTTK